MEINRSIVAQLAEIGRELFDRLGLDSGTYTAAQLSKNQHPANKNLPLYELPEDVDGSEIRTVAAGTFTLEFPLWLVFRFLDDFEKLAKIPTKEKSKFIKANDALGLSFFVNIPKEAAEVAKFATSDPVREVLQFVCLDVKNSALVATDTKILAEFSITIEEAPAEECPKIFINPKHLKNMVGRCRVQLIDDEQTLGRRVATITTEAGEIFKTDAPAHNFPDYRRVYPSALSLSGYLQFAKEGVKAFKNFAKSAKKTAEQTSYIKISVEEGETAARLLYFDHCNQTEQTISATLSAPACGSFTFGLRPDCFDGAAGAWAGGLWIVDPSRPMVLDCKGARAVVIMPVCCDTPRGEAVKTDTFGTLDRLAMIPEYMKPAEAPKRAKTKKNAPHAVEVAEVAPAETQTPAEVVAPVAETTAHDVEIINFVDWLAWFIEIIIKSFYRAELAKTIDRARKLAELAGVDFLDVLADALPMPSEVVEVAAVDVNAEAPDSPPTNTDERAPVDCVAAPMSSDGSPVAISAAVDVADSLGGCGGCGRAAPGSPGSVPVAVGAPSDVGPVGCVSVAVAPGGPPGNCGGFRPSHFAAWCASPGGTHRIRDGTPPKIPTKTPKFAF